VVLSTIVWTLFTDSDCEVFISLRKTGLRESNYCLGLKSIDLYLLQYVLS